MPDLSAFLRAALLCIAALLCSAEPRGAMAQTGSDLLQPNQTVSISVGRWDPVEETYIPWESFGGEFEIGPSGDIVLPMIGAVQVIGLTTAELGTELSNRLQLSMGLRGEVQTGVKIIDFGEIYVLGDVQQPGAHPFAPGMTALQALSQAGGVEGVDSTLVRGDRSALSALGSYRVLEIEVLRRLATLARLNAELEDRSIEVPEALAQAPSGEQLIQQEREIKSARDSAYESNLSQLDDLEALLRQSITSLDQQLELRRTQLSLLETELSNASSLVEQGLSTASRQSALERQVADQQVRELELETARLEVQQSLNEARRDRLDLINTRSRQLVEGIQEERGAIDELQVKMETESALYAEAMQTGTGLLQLGSGGTAKLTVTRRENGESRTFAVERSDEVRSGDVLEVLLPGLEPYDSVPMRRLDGVGLDPSLPATLSPDAALTPTPAPESSADGAAAPPS